MCNFHYNIGCWFLSQFFPHTHFSARVFKSCKECPQGIYLTALSLWMCVTLITWPEWKVCVNSPVDLPEWLESINTSCIRCCHDFFFYLIFSADSFKWHWLINCVTAAPSIASLWKDFIGFYSLLSTCLSIFIPFHLICFAFQAPICR